MSSPIGELPVRRHLLPEVAALLLQAAAGARQRALRRLALLGERPPEEVPYEIAPGSGAVGEAAAAVPVQVFRVPEQVAAGGQALPRDPVLPGGAGVPPAVTEAPPSAAGRRAEALPPPIVRLMQAAAIRAERARVLEQEALQSVISLPVRRGGLAAVPPQKGVHAPLRPVVAGAAAGGPVDPPGAFSHGQAVLSGGSETRRSAFWPSPPAAAYGAPFGPHPAPPGPAGPVAGPLPAVPPAGPQIGSMAGPAPGWGSPVMPGAAYPESELLLDERLRGQLARILRADALRHGLDLKER